MHSSIAEGLFEPHVLVASSPLDGDVGALHPAERSLIERAVASRRREFATGRARARELLAELGHGDVVIASDADRVPVWPLGVAGSISHTDDWCVVAMARIEDGGGLNRCMGLGVDVEHDRELEPELIEAICTPDERSWLASRDDASWLATQIFSAKEALYKACFPTLRERWDFQDVDVSIDTETGAFRAHVPESAGGTMTGRILRGEGRIWTGVSWPGPTPLASQEIGIMQ